MNPFRRFTRWAGCQEIRSVSGDGLFEEIILGRRLWSISDISGMVDPDSREELYTVVAAQGGCVKTNEGEGDGIEAASAVQAVVGIQPTSLKPPQREQFVADHLVPVSDTG